VIPVSGKNNGSSKDIIDAIELIQHSPSWTSQDQRGMELCPASNLDWLLNSDFGKKESQAINNNHGGWYIYKLNLLPYS
jgi:alginate lyase